MQTNLKVLRVEFNAQIKNYEIPAFRGAIARKVGYENDWFHNHIDNEKYAYRYPLIQYKLVRGRPALFCLHQGVEEIHKFFEQRNWDIELGNRVVEMTIARLDMNQFAMQVAASEQLYSIHNWIALSQDSYHEYLTMESEAERVRLLETKLIGNMLSFGKGIGWTIDKRITCQITKMGETQRVTVKGVHVIGFNLQFKTNVFLPNYMGLGRNVSIGFGVVRKVSKN